MTSGKLVRDRIPEIIRARGEDPMVHTIDGDRLFDALITKLSEESQELRSAPPTHQVEELADMLEVICGLASHLAIELEDLEELRASKREQRGGFTKGLWLEMCSSPNHQP